jgi:hypothetical protein
MLWAVLPHGLLTRSLKGFLQVSASLCNLSQNIENIFKENFVCPYIPSEENGVYGHLDKKANSQNSSGIHT